MLTQQQTIEALEKIVDQSDLASVIIALGLMCHEKAEHIRENWQDPITARVWDRCGKNCMTLSENSAVITVS
jgi:hypothetical protein